MADVSSEFADSPLPSPAELNDEGGDTIREGRAAYGSAKSGYRDLRVWQLGIELAVDIYKLTRSFPKEELFGLASQLRRAVSSISLNVAEGWGRNRRPELARFAEIARGSVAECESALELAFRLDYISSDQHHSLLVQLGELSGMLLSLIRKLKS